MNTAWVLIIALWPGANNSTGFTIENLSSVAECNRVARVIIDWKQQDLAIGRNPAYKCIEVVKK